MRLIDSEALKESIRKALGIDSLARLLPAEKTIVNQIDHAPTINAKPIVRGQWVEAEGICHGIRVSTYKCSRCHKMAGFNANDNFWWLSKYCPNCGCKLNGGKGHAPDRC